MPYIIIATDQNGATSRVVFGTAKRQFSVFKNKAVAEQYAEIRRKKNADKAHRWEYAVTEIK